MKKFKKHIANIRSTGYNVAYKQERTFDNDSIIQNTKDEVNGVLEIKNNYSDEMDDQRIRREAVLFNFAQGEFFPFLSLEAVYFFFESREMKGRTKE